MATKKGRTQAYSAGNKNYGLAGTSSPNAGPTSAQGLIGYKNRDKASRVRNAALRKMKAQQKGKHASADAKRVM